VRPSCPRHANQAGEFHKRHSRLPSEIQHGWLKDKFGLCWQIVPANIFDLISHPNAMQAMYKMKKFDIAELERAAQS
jgi:predicted 3-demethylubiquinone-9 3-methyltransferase (glyoxalase superfamily)